MKNKEMFKYRDVWMGIAILWVVLFHVEIEISNPILAGIKIMGYAGVDIFMLASGIGCYYSLRNNSDILMFIKRRITRIIPTYWTFLIIWIPYKIIVDDIPLTAVLGNILCIQGFTGNGSEFNWYISAIWLFYIFAPLLKEIVDQLHSFKEFLIVLVLLIAFSIPFWNSYTLIITVTRIPIFFIGMYWARKAEEDKAISKLTFGKLLLLAIIGFVLLVYFFLKRSDLLWSHGFYWYPFILIIPCACVLISWIMQQIEDVKIGKVIKTFLVYVGKYSFEIYLIHILLFDILKKYILHVESNKIWYWNIAIVLIVPCSVWLSALVKGIMSSYIPFSKKK